MQTQNVIPYLNWLQQRWGQAAYSSVASSLQYQSQLKLSDWHLYGSSRLGTQQIDTTLYTIQTTINGFDSLGQMIIDEVLD